MENASNQEADAQESDTVRHDVPVLLQARGGLGGGGYPSNGHYGQPYEPNLDDQQEQWQGCLTRFQTVVVEGDVDTARELIQSNGVDIEDCGIPGTTNLHVAVGRSLHGMVQLLLEFGANVEAVLEGHWTALHQAVKTGDLRMVRLLIEWDADVKARDCCGRTPLIVAMGHGNVPIIELLLRSGSDKTAKMWDGRTAYDFAGDSEEIQALLSGAQLLQGPSLGQGPPKPKHTVSTADQLPRAPTDDRNKMFACHGFQATVVDFFIGDTEQRVEMQTSIYDLLYGRGPAELKRTAAPPSVRDTAPSFRWYHLPANNLEWVQALVRRHLYESGGEPILSEETRERLGLSTTHDRHLKAGSTESMFKRPASHYVKTDIDTSSAQFLAIVPFLHFETLKGSGALSKAIENARFWQYDEDILFSTMPGNDNRKAVEHLNKSLIYGYFRTFDPRTGTQGSLQPRRTLDQYFYTHLSTAQSRDRDQVVSRFTRFDPQPKVFMVDQLWLWIINEDTVISCLPVQWNAWEQHYSQARHKSRKSRTKHKSRMPKHGFRAIPKSLNRALHRREGPAHPNDDQDDPSGVSVFDLLPPPPERLPTGHTLLHPKTDETAEPVNDEFRDAGAAVPDFTPFLKKSPLNVEQAILKHFTTKHRAPITSPISLAKLITNFCINVFDQHDTPAQYQFLDFFETSLGINADIAARRLASFRASLAPKPGTIDDGDIDDTLVNLRIETETGLLVEIEDIRDELNILRMVLEDQQQAVQEMENALQSSPLAREDNPTDEIFSLKHNKVLESHLHRIEKMETMAEKTSKLLLSLLDLKQKQASVSEAFSARAQAEISATYAEKQAGEAEESARQGRTLMLFTVVTIVFLPLSFMSAFFAINIDAFPTNDDGALPLGYVVKYMIGISAGLSIPFILVTFNQERVWKMLARLRDFIVGLPMTVWAILILAGIPLIILWTSKLSTGSKIPMTLAIGILGTFAVCGWMITYLMPNVTHKRKNHNIWKKSWQKFKSGGGLRLRRRQLKSIPSENDASE